MINTRSNTIFITDEITKNTTGVLLSPIDRMIAEIRLYKYVAGIPAKMITIYRYAPSIMLSGVRINSKIGRQNTTVPAVMTTAKIADR